MIPPGIAYNDERTRPRDWKWSSREMNFVRTRTGIPEPTLTALGLTAASAGGHWDFILHDDLISNEAQQSQVVMESVKDWFDTTPFLGPTPETMCAWISCTRWRFDDVYEYAKEKHGFKLHRWQALTDGRSIWEDRWPTQSLLDQQAKDPVTFSSQMQNDPMPGKDLALDPSWIRYGRIAQDEHGTYGFRIDDAHYDPTIGASEDAEYDPPQFTPLSHMVKVLLVDPVPAKSSDRKASPHSRMALVLKAIDCHGRRYWLDIWAGREQEPEPRMLAMLEQWGASRIGIEEVLFSSLYRRTLNHTASRLGKPIPAYIALKPKMRDKDSRIIDKAKSFRAGFEYVNESIKPLLLSEYATFPYGATKDILDAGAYDEDPGVLPRPASDDEREYDAALQEWRQSGDDGRDEVTGY